jgi:soluble lytic murein transglycosylase-like protein
MALYDDLRNSAGNAWDSFKQYFSGGPQQSVSPANINYGTRQYEPWANASQADLQAEQAAVPSYSSNAIDNPQQSNYPDWDPKVFNMANTPKPRMSTELNGQTFDEYNKGISQAPAENPQQAINRFGGAKDLPEEVTNLKEANWRNNPAIQNIIAEDPIIERIIMTESSGKADALNKGTGAKGLMQIMKNTAEKETGFGVNYNLKYDELGDPEKNVKYGAAYFKGLKRYFKGSDRDALIAYNWGPGNAKKWLKAGGDLGKLPKETRNYITKILGDSAA